jgi:hypothetical protein
MGDPERCACEPETFRWEPTGKPCILRCGCGYWRLWVRVDSGRPWFIANLPALRMGAEPPALPLASEAKQEC